MLAKENGLIDVLQTTNRATVPRMESIVREHRTGPGSRKVQNTETNCVGYDKEVQGPWNPLSSSRKRPLFHLNA